LVVEVLPDPLPELLVPLRTEDDEARRAAAGTEPFGGLDGLIADNDPEVVADAIEFRDFDDKDRASALMGGAAQWRTPTASDEEWDDPDLRVGLGSLLLLPLLVHPTFRWADDGRNVDDS
jgi:hypothetical protein